MCPNVYPIGLVTAGISGRRATRRLSSTERSKNGRTRQGPTSGACLTALPPWRTVQRDRRGDHGEGDPLADLARDRTADRCQDGGALGAAPGARGHWSRPRLRGASVGRQAVALMSCSHGPTRIPSRRPPT